ALGARSGCLARGDLALPARAAHGPTRLTSAPAQLAPGTISWPRQHLDPLGPNAPRWRKAYRSRRATASASCRSLMVAPCALPGVRSPPPAATAFVPSDRGAVTDTAVTKL